MKRFLKFAGFLGMLALTAASTTVLAAEGDKAYPTCYEDGTLSPVTANLKSIYANGTSLIFKNGKMYEDAAPVATCQGHIHHFSSLFLGLPCFPCSKSWSITRFSLSSTLWVLVAEKCTSTK